LKPQKKLRGLCKSNIASALKKKKENRQIKERRFDSEREKKSEAPKVVTKNGGKNNR